MVQRPGALALSMVFSGTGRRLMARAHPALVGVGSTAVCTLNCLCKRGDAEDSLWRQFLLVRDSQFALLGLPSGVLTVADSAASCKQARKLLTWER